MSSEKVKENLFSGIEVVVLESLLEVFNKQSKANANNAAGLSVASLLSETSKNKPSQAKLAAAAKNNAAISNSANLSTPGVNTSGTSPIQSKPPISNSFNNPASTSINTTSSTESQAPISSTQLQAGTMDVSELATVTGVRDNDEVLRALYTLEGKSLARPHPEGDFTSTSWKITQTGIKALGLMKQNLISRRPKPKKISLTGH